MKKKIHWLLLALPLGVGLWVLYRFVFGRASVDDKGKFNFTSSATRELRANNPLGVSLSGTYEWEGMDYTKSVPNKTTGKSIEGVDDKLGDQLAIFKTTQEGLNAAAWLLQDAYFNKGFRTIGAIGDRWSGKTGSPFSDYSVSLSKIMKLPIDSQLNFATDGIGLMKALSRMENGTPFVIGIPDEMFRAAVDYGVNS